MATRFTMSPRRDGQGIIHSGVDPNNLFVHGESFTITGTGFGTRTGYEDHINTSGIYDLSLNSNFGVVGRWDGSNFVGAGERFKVQSEGINGKCLKATRVNGGEPNITLLFNYDTPVALGKKIFSSVWVKHLVTGSATGGQWKYGRWQTVNNSLSDKLREAYWSGVSSTPTNKVQVRDSANFPSPDLMVGWGPDTAPYLPHARNKWVRMDMLHTMPTAYNLPDTYKCEAWIHDPDGIIAPLYINFTDNQVSEHISPYAASGDEWTCHLHQNYLHNGDYGTASHTLWTDKAYENVGDNRRVELANNADITLATRRFILPASSWSDTSITLTCDEGNITGSRWVHVLVDNVSVYSESV